MGSVGNTTLGGGGGGIQVQGLHVSITHTTIARNRLGPALVAGQALLVLTAPNTSSSSANIYHSIIANHTEGKSGSAAIVVQEGNTVTFSRGLFTGNTKDTNLDGAPMPVGTINGLSTMFSSSSAGFISSGSPNYNYHIRIDSPAKDQATGSTTVDDMDGQSRPYNGAPDLGADEYWPFPLSATSGDGVLLLNWATGTSGLTGGVSNYQILVTCAAGANPPDQGGCNQPINAGTAVSFTLTGLSNFKQYAATIYARDSSQNLIATSNIVTAFPTNLLIYLPLVMR
jgi:hypothetical protein